MRNLEIGDLFRSGDAFYEVIYVMDDGKVIAKDEGGHSKIFDSANIRNPYELSEEEQNKID